MQGNASDWFKGKATLGKLSASTNDDESGRGTLSHEDAAIQDAIAARDAARKARDFPKADAIRADMLAVGVLLEDGPGGTTWRRVN
jgi:cysteinyl-tRNA synthetase